MPIRRNTGGCALGKVSAAADALSEMLAPPELKADAEKPWEDSSDEGGAAPAGAALSDESEEDEGSDAEDVFALSACDDSALEKMYRDNFLYRWLRAVQELGRQPIGCIHQKEEPLRA